MSYSLNQLYKVTRMSKQAISQYQKRQEVFDEKVSNLLVDADKLRSEHPGCGVEKMYYTLKPDFIGRDKFIEIFMSLGYRVKKVKNYHRTTIPASHKYPNLIEGLLVKRKNIVWQSDITYFNINGRYYYLVFIIDVYSREIVGFAVSDHLRAEANIRALKMAFQIHLTPRIHHSDRGSQYIEKRYTKLLTKNGTEISMGLKAQDNAYAERINGTIKNDYLKHWGIKSFEDLKSKVRKAVFHYNEKRIHDSLPKRMAPKKFSNQVNKYEIIEEIYAPNRITPIENNFCWSDDIKENDLFCMLN